MDWQKYLGRESIYFVLMVVTSFLFWVALAVILEQKTIAPEYLYSRERNGFMLTIGIFYFIRLNAWMINRKGSLNNRAWETGGRIARKNETTEWQIVGEAREECGKIIALFKNDWMPDNRRHKAKEDGSTC